MKKILFQKNYCIFLLLLFLSASMVPSVISTKQKETSSNVLLRSAQWVDDDATPGGDGSPEHPFQHIQDAVDAANENDQINVRNGTYNESIDITKRLNLCGGYSDGNDTDSIINGGNIAIYIHNTSLNVDKGLISNFIIQNSGIAIFIDHSINIDIYHNVIRNNYRGIFIFHSSIDKIDNNTIYNNTWAGINIEATDHSTIIITDNCIYNNFYGLLISDTCSVNTVSYNYFEHNTYGVIIIRCSFNTIAYNDFINNTNQATFQNCRNRWHNNYWDDKKLFSPVYIIWGVYQSLLNPIFQFQYFPNVDWRPANEPNTNCC